MLAVERRNKITELVNKNKSVHVPELSIIFNVTEETIRRDLEKLENLGIVIRTYGGATLAGGSVKDTPVTEREIINYEGKDIGSAAAGLIKDGETVFLDASTLALYVAKHIKNRRDITVITNSQKVIMELSNAPDINVVCTGGLLSKNNLSYTGKSAESCILGNYYANKAFLSCWGISLSRGLTDSNEQEAEVKKAMIKCSDMLVLLCDSSKLGKIGYSVIASLDEVDYFITDTEIDSEWENELLSRKINIVLNKAASIK